MVSKGEEKRGTYVLCPPASPMFSVTGCSVMVMLFIMLVTEVVFMVIVTDSLCHISW